MNKKGFISTAVIYSFFLVFIAIVIGIVVSYSNRRILLSAIKDDARNTLDKFVTYDCLSQGIKYLNECIIYQNGGNNVTRLKSGTLATTPVETPGLYYDQDERTYYFRGNVKNNHVQFGAYEDYLYYGYTVTINTFTEEVNVSEIGTYKSETECRKYYPQVDKVTGEDGTTTQDICAQIYAPGDLMYWRIVSIDKNDNIQLIYEGTSISEEVKEDTSLDSGGLTNWWDVLNFLNKFLKTILKSMQVEEGFIKKDYNKTLEYLDRRNSNNWYDKYIGKYYDYYVSRKSARLLTTEEAISAGAIYYSPNNTEKYSTYLNQITFHLNDSINSTTNYALDTSGKIIDVSKDTQYNFRPVIELNNYVIIKKGNGTKDNPYVLEEVGY